MKHAFIVPLAWTICALPLLAAAPRDGRSYDFPIYTNQPPGRQLEGGHAPAATQPLVPEETRKRLHVPSGFEARLFAAEPEVVNPVAMAWDSRGRLWVLELYEYPKGAPQTRTPRDRIKILEDVDGDGTADKVQVWADGLNLATGLALGHGGAYVGQAPHLLFLQDTDGDDRADTREEVLTGFGLEDRHELLNGFAWGPDGWLYMTHGVFTHSNVRDPKDPMSQPVTLNAALARFHPVTKRFEVYADGTSNPWSVDWNARGDAFIGACVIQHLFHMAPGGQYNRQGGTWAHPYGYVRDLPSQGLPALVDWRHFRAAHCGITVYQGSQFPTEWQGLVLLGNIHQNAVNCDRLRPAGATYRAMEESQLLGPEQGHDTVGAGNFMVSRDPWFRPVSIQTGPDGALWVADWYDRYPCYQNAQADPNGVDREYGRIWRVVWVGDKNNAPVPSRPFRQMDLTQAPDDDLVGLLAHPNNWQRRQAQRVLTERASGKDLLLKALQPGRTFPDPSQPAHQRTAAFWTLQSAGHLGTDELRTSALDGHRDIRVWTARCLGDQGDVSPERLGIVLSLAGDAEPAVRAAAAVAVRLFTSGSLTVNTTPRQSVATEALLPHYRALLERPSTLDDFYYPHIVWMAMEPRVAENPESFLALLREVDTSVSAYCLYRVARRVSDLSDAVARTRELNRFMEFLGGMAERTALAASALDGLIKAQEAKGPSPTIDLGPILARLSANPELASRARRLATLYGDTGASRMLLAWIYDPKATATQKQQGIRAARESQSDAAEKALLAFLKSKPESPALTVEAVRALAVFKKDDMAYALLDAWPTFDAGTRRAAAEVLVARTKWARALLTGIKRDIVRPEDISATARRGLAMSLDATVQDDAEKLLGPHRATSEEKQALIQAKRQVVLNGQPDIDKGREVTRQACLVCHKLHGEGADVGPDLTGVGRSSLAALLHNIIDPNEVIGNGYEMTEVQLKDDSTLSGRIVEDTDQRLRLVAAGPVEHVIRKEDIARKEGRLLIEKKPISLMPEGLEQMPDEDFRNMMWFLLNPPEDRRPWSPELRRELLGEAPEKEAAAAPAHDLESVALWNPDWRVVCPPFEIAPAKLTEYHGRRNVLLTHPIDRNKPSALETTLDLPPGRHSELAFYVASHDSGNWELRVQVDGKNVHRRVVDARGERWKQVRVDLLPWAGRSVSVRLENAANDWNWEFGYWSDLQLHFNKPSKQASGR